MSFFEMIHVKVRTLVYLLYLNMVSLQIKINMCIIYTISLFNRIMIK